MTQIKFKELDLDHMMFLTELYLNNTCCVITCIKNLTNYEDFFAFKKRNKKTSTQYNSEHKTMSCNMKHSTTRL